MLCFLAYRIGRCAGMTVWRGKWAGALHRLSLTEVVGNDEFLSKYSQVRGSELKTSMENTWNLQHEGYGQAWKACRG